MLINILWHLLGANQYGGPICGERDLFLAAAKDCGIVFLPKPITTKHQSVFWLVRQSWRMLAICIGICLWISPAAASGAPVALTTANKTKPSSGLIYHLIKLITSS